MSKTLGRIDPEDAEQFDPDTDALLRLWAAHKLDVQADQIDRVLVEVTGGCGEGTCEFTTARAEVILIDGRVFLGPDQGFGLFIQDIVEMDVSPDGTERRGGDMWDLYDEDGKKVAPKEPPRPTPAARPSFPPEPQVGAFRVEVKTDQYGIADRRTEVLTAHGWVNLLELVALYDRTQANR